MTRWEQLYVQKRDEVLAAPPSLCAESAVRLFVAHDKRRILDLGCGIGRDAFHLTGNGLSVVGIDAAASALRIANTPRGVGRNWPSFAQADARVLPFPDASFDGVYSFGLLHEFTQDTREQDIAAVMSEISRVLKPHGLLVLAVLSGEPEQGLPQVCLFAERAFDTVTRSLHRIEKRAYNDIGCTGKSDYRIWYGAFGK